MVRRKIVGGAAVCALIVGLAFVTGCGRKGPPEQPGDIEPPPRELPRKLIGVLLPLSGEHKSDGEALLAGLTLALQKKGAAVGLDESCLEIRDYGDSVTDSLGLARDLMEVKDVPVVVGPVSPRAVEIIDELARQRRVAVLTPASAPMKLSEIRPAVWRLTYTDEQEGKALAAFAWKKLYRTAAIITDSNLAASEVRADAFRAHLEASGGHVVTQLSYTGGQTNFRRLVRMAAQKKPEVFYLPGGRLEAAGIIDEMKTQRVFGSVLGSTHWDAGVRFPASAGPGWAVFAPSRFYAGRTNVVTTAFVKDFRAAYRRHPGVMAALGYDAGLVILDAFAHAGPGRGALADAVGSVKLLTGATGRITVRKRGLAAGITVLRLKERDFVFETAMDIE